MPTINLNRKRKDYHYKNSDKKDNLNHKVYNTDIWRNLRLEYLKNNPLCKECLKQGYFISAVEVHHKTPISTGATLEEKQALGYDYNNLIGLQYSI